MSKAARDSYELARPRGDALNSTANNLRHANLAARQKFRQLSVEKGSAICESFKNVAAIYSPNDFRSRHYYARPSVTDGGRERQFDRRSTVQ